MARKDAKAEFSTSTKREAFALAEEKCQTCAAALTFNGAEFHHRKPVQDKGDNNVENCVVLCPDCHHGSEEKFRALHPNSPPRILFVKSIPYKRRLAIAKYQQKKYEQDLIAERAKLLISWTRKGKHVDKENLDGPDIGEHINE